MIDLVYVLGTGSKWQDNELRYSLRSVEKHVSGYRNLYLVGSCPFWIQNAVHIKMDDLYGYNRDRNIYSKIFVACREKDITEEFLFINDDHFFQKDYVAAEIPYYHKGDLFQRMNMRPAADNYRITLSNTYYYLKKHNLPKKHFDTHTPIIYNKTLFTKALAIPDWEVWYGYVIKSLYCNTLGIEGEYLEDCKLDRPYTRFEINQRIHGRPLFSIGDNSLNDDMKATLQELYPTPSQWEV